MNNCYALAGRSILLLLLVLLLTAVPGCGGRKTYPVEGKVVFKDGTPLTGGLVMFEPIDSELPVCARGDIQRDGSFRLSTFHKYDGALEGRHRAVVTPPLPANGRESQAPPPIDPRFGDYASSKLEFTVVRGKNRFRIEVEKP